MAFEVIPYDDILGLGNKKKKAEKKVKKAEKQLSKGNIKAAERKIGKAVKKLSQTSNPNESPTKQKIVDTQNKIQQAKTEREILATDTTRETVSRPVTGTGEIISLDPVTSQDGGNIPGSGSTGMNASGGGGGSFEDASEWKGFEEQAQFAADETEIETDENGNPVTSPNIKTFLIVAAIAAAVYFLPKLLKP